MEATVNTSNNVKLMRKIREKSSLELMNMTFEEQKAHMKSFIEKQKKQRQLHTTKYKHNKG